MKPAGGDPAEILGELWRDWKPAGIGWDVGANCGQAFAHMLRFCETVHAFEAAAESFSYLQAMWEHEDRVVSHHLAVSDADGEISLAVLPAQIATGQLVTPGTTGMEWDPGSWDDVRLRQVAAKTCDTLAEKLGVPGFVTVDTEGHETKVLEGARKLVEGRKTDWLIEFHTPAGKENCQRMLEAAGHVVEVVRHPHYPPDSPMWHQHGWLRAEAPERGSI